MKQPKRRLCKYLVYKIYEGKERLIDEVYYDSDMSIKDVEKSLIEHDNYPINISVFKIDN